MYTGGKVSATVKIKLEKKEKLDKFVASLLIREGIKITLQEALSLIIDFALENEEEIIRRGNNTKTERVTAAGRRPSMESHRKSSTLGDKGFVKKDRRVTIW